MEQKNSGPGFELGRLKEKFPEKDIEWRLAQADEKGQWAKCLAYVDARAVQNRLDEVCGPENWKDEYLQLNGGMLCKLSIRVNGEWVTKQNGSPETAVEAFKGGFSKALVRTAATWGIGRYLYDLTENFANIVKKGDPGARYATTKTKQVFFWTPPKLPHWALPPGTPAKANAPTANTTQGTKPPPADTINQAQITRLYTLATKAGWTQHDVHELIERKAGIKSTKEVKKAHYDSLCRFIETNPIALEPADEAPPIGDDDIPF